MITCSEESYQATLRRLEQIIELLLDGNFYKAQRYYHDISKCAFCDDALKRSKEKRPSKLTAGWFRCKYCVWTQGYIELNLDCSDLREYYDPLLEDEWIVFFLAIYGYLLTWEKV